MKKLHAIVISVLLIGLTALIFSAYKIAYPANKVIQKSISNKGFALIELYTSEGCSSCPPADRLLGDIINDPRYKGMNIYALAFHVDYWNHLGWKDSFSNKVYSQRQSDYDKALNDETYTPQMIVNGMHAFVGSESRDAEKYINQALNEQAKANIIINGFEPFNGKLSVNYRLTGDFSDGTLYIALAENKIEHHIKSGENKGRLLSHNYVVKELEKQTSLTGEGSFNVSIPDGKNMSNYSVVLFLQNARTKAIIAATGKSL